MKQNVISRKSLVPHVPWNLLLFVFLGSKVYDLTLYIQIILYGAVGTYILYKIYKYHNITELDIEYIIIKSKLTKDINNIETLNEIL